MEGKQLETPKHTETMCNSESTPAEKSWEVGICHGDRFAYAYFAPAFFWVPINRFVSADFAKKTKCHLIIPSKGVCTEKTWRKMLV